MANLITGVIPGCGTKRGDSKGGHGRGGIPSLQRGFEWKLQSKRGDDDDIR